MFQIGNKIGNRFKKDYTPWNKGKKLSKEHIRKIKENHKPSITQFKQGHNTWNKRTKGIMKAWNKGLKGFMAKEKHYNWKGGITPEQLKIRHSFEMNMWRRDVFIRDEFTCQSCGTKNIYIEAHHIKSFSKYPKLRFELDNGKTLCKKCHKKIGFII